MMTPEVLAILAERDIVPIDKSARPHVPMVGAPAETRAGPTLERIYQRRGAEHLRFLCTAVGESVNNRRVLTAPVITAVSDIIIGHPHWAEDERFLPMMDATPLDRIAIAAKMNQHVCAMRCGIATMLFTGLWPVFETQPNLRGV